MTPERKAELWVIAADCRFGPTHRATVVELLSEIDRLENALQAFEDESVRRTCKHASENYADLMRRLANAPDSNDAAVLEEKTK